MLIGALDIWLADAIGFRDQPMLALAVILTTLRYALITWLVAAVIAGIGNLVVRSFATNRRGLDAALIRLCFRILSITGALTVILYAAGQLGLSITPIIAGLGVGGLAVALAIRPTLENIVGGFVLFADKPVRVGEFCSFGSMMGTVEEIGLRSTRLRGLDRTVITVPNADFAQMQIVNFTRRDMNLFQCKLGLRYETTPDQLRFVAAKIRKLLIQHSKVSPDPARVRFSELGSSAYILDVFAFIQSADWNEFMAVKEDLNFRIVEIVRDSGTGFAFPSQTVYLTRDHGIDTARGSATEAEVQQWREENRLPFPEYDFAERAEMTGTMPFPPEGSPDFRPALPRAADTPPMPNRPKGRWQDLFRHRKEAAPAP
jgi:MscS family membrane protein